MTEGKPFFSIDQGETTSWNLYDLEIIRERIREHYYPADTENQPLPNLDIRKEKYELSDSYGPRFLVSLLIIQITNYPHQFIGYHSIYDLDPVTF